LQQRSEEDSVVLFSAGTAHRTLMHFITDPLALKNLGFPFTAKMT
jgi:hypothetical protein